MVPKGRTVSFFAETRVQERHIFGAYHIFSFWNNVWWSLYSSRVIDHLVSSSKVSGDNHCVAYVYWDYQRQEQQSTLNLLASIPKQAVIAGCKLPVTEMTAIRNLLDKKKRQQSLKLDEAFETLAAVLKNFRRTYICVDALDECTDAYRRNVITTLYQLQSTLNMDNNTGMNSNHTVMLFFTGRPQIQGDINSHLLPTTIMR